MRRRAASALARSDRPRRRCAAGASAISIAFLEMRDRLAERRTVGARSPASSPTFDRGPGEARLREVMGEQLRALPRRCPQKKRLAQRPPPADLLMQDLPPALEQAFARRCPGPKRAYERVARGAGGSPEREERAPRSSSCAAQPAASARRGRRRCAAGDRRIRAQLPRRSARCP